MHIVVLLFSSLLISVAELQTNETTTTVWTTISNSDNNYVTKQHDCNEYVVNNKSFILSDYPYVVFIEMSTIYVCTGTLIAPLYVLTAGHCTYGRLVSQIDVYRVSKLTKLSIPRKISQIYHHNNYNNDTHTADISLMKLKNPFRNFEDFIVLPGNPLEFSQGNSPSCLTIGFGMIYKVEVNRHLQTTEYYGYIASTSVIYGREACQFNTTSEWKEFVCSKPDKNNMVCPGDVGNPLICDGYLYGVASSIYNIKEPSIKSVCGSCNTQTMNVLLYDYKDWIETIIKNTGNIIIISEKSYSLILIILVFYKMLLR